MKKEWTEWFEKVEKMIKITYRLSLMALIVGFYFIISAISFKDSNVNINLISALIGVYIVRLSFKGFSCSSS